MTLFDAQKSIAARDAGIDRAAKNRKKLLEYAKGVAVNIAKAKGECDADEVAKVLSEQGISLGNAAGALFRDSKIWEWTGRFTYSERVNAHRNLLRIWRLK